MPRGGVHADRTRQRHRFPAKQLIKTCTTSCPTVQSEKLQFVNPGSHYGTCSSTEKGEGPPKLSISQFIPSTQPSISLRSHCRVPGNTARSSCWSSLSGVVL